MPKIGQGLSGTEISPAAIAGMVLSLQLVNFSFVAESGKVGAIYVVAAASLLLGCGLFLRGRSLVLSPAHVGGLLLCLFFIAGSFHAINPGWALLCSGVAVVYLLVFFILTNVAWFKREFAEKLIDTLLMVGLLAALLGLYEYVWFFTCGPSRFSLIPYLLPPDVNPRVGGPIGQSNLFAMFLSVVLLAYIYRLLHGFRVTFRPWSNRLRFLPMLTVAAIFFLTYSRGGIVSLTVVIGIMTWLVARGRYLKGDIPRRKEFFLLLLGLGLCFLLSQANMFGATYDGGGASRLVSEESGSNTNTSGRFIFWTSAILIFLDYPWLGAGLDNYRFLMNGYGPESHNILRIVEYEAMQPSFWAHNEYLQLLCEGGIFVFVLILLFVVSFVVKFWRHFICEHDGDEPLFLYSHLFLFPFLIQSSFEWPLRHPALLLLFVALAGILVSQYPLREYNLTMRLRLMATTCALIGLVITGLLYRQELVIVSFKRAWLTQPIESTLSEFTALTASPYSSYRVLHNTMPRYVGEALREEQDAFAETLLPHSQKLALLEGTGSQWYDLARLYLRVNRQEDAREAIREAFELKPTDDVIFAFLHHLNVLKAVQVTGRPVEAFYPTWVKPVNINFQDLKHD